MKKSARFGPAGNSKSFYEEGLKHTHQAPEWVAKKGLDAYEYQGGNGIRGSEDAFRKIGLEAAKAGIAMSVHAPYYISLSGIDIEKRLKSIEYIRQSLSTAEYLGADIIVVHTGSASKITRGEAVHLACDTLTKTFENIDVPKNIRIGLETMGKKNQLGTLDEVLDICGTVDRRLCPVIDFGHINARECGGVFVTVDDYRRVFESISERLGAEYIDDLHCHFSKIEYTSSGEKKHLTFSDTVYGPDFEPLAEAIVRDGLTPRIICESDGTMAEDALFMKKSVLDKNK